MKKYKHMLVDAINQYDESSPESFRKLKDMVCIISEKRMISDVDYILDYLLNVASNKMRVFGYSIMNGILETHRDDEQFNLLSDEILKASYTTESGTLLDYNQYKVLNTYNKLDQKRILLSAPTSFGKTRLLQEIIFNNRELYKMILLIFPTNALLFENFARMNAFNEKYRLNYKIMNNTNIDDEKLDRAIFILTPERYLKLKSDFADLKFDFFFMDEIYKIDNFFNSHDENTEDDRDKVFRIVLYHLSKSVHDFYLAGPYVNLNLKGNGLSTFVKLNKVEVIQIDEELVLKNIIECKPGEIIKVGNEDVLIRKESGNKYISTTKIINAIRENKKGSTLVYCDRKYTIDILAHRLIDDKIATINRNVRVKRFISHLENRYSYFDEGVHIIWPLQKYIEFGICVHYGSLPKYIQLEMLKLFNSNQSDLILSTTSITEGVNTNAKNLIFLGNKKGKKELKVFDVKNIIGRAGRYYHHFIGNIYIFHKEIIEKNQSSETEPLDFLTYTDENLSDVDIDNAEVGDLRGINVIKKEKRMEVVSRSKIPVEILKKNSTVDWLTQIKLYDVIKEKPRAELMNLKEAFESLQKFISKNENNLMNVFLDLRNCNIVNTNEVIVYTSIVKNYSSQGFRGLLTYEVESKKSKKRTNNSNVGLSESEYATCYREAFNKLNTIIEFKVPKFLNLYASLLSYVCFEEDIDLKQQDINVIINYYERGLFTSVGNFLWNNGFPTITIKILETKYQDLMNLETTQFFDIIKSEKEPIWSLLDSYEKELLFEIFSM